jgi:hypothetical protein
MIESAQCPVCGQARRLYPRPITCLHCGFVEESRVFLRPGDKRQVCFSPDHVKEIRYGFVPNAHTWHLAAKITHSSIEIKKGHLLRRIIIPDGRSFVEVRYDRKGIEDKISFRF